MKYYIVTTTGTTNGDNMSPALLVRAKNKEEARDAVNDLYSIKYHSWDIESIKPIKKVLGNYDVALVGWV